MMMPSPAHTINFDFANDTISDANPVENVGMHLMRLAAKSTRPIDYSGLRYLNTLIKAVLPSNQFVRVILSDNTCFEFPYGDGYWGRMLDTASPYSQSEENFLRAIRHLDYAFIDCGANFGYMSAIVSGRAFGAKPSIAIEADADNYSILERNWELNGRRFDLRHNAVFSHSGVSVDFGGRKHEARAIRENASDPNSHQIETLALRDLRPWIKQQNRKHLVLKLDIEGVEIPALAGADSLLQSDPCVMYEDHAMDRTHEVSRYLKEEMGMQLFCSGEVRCRKIHHYDELDRIKSNPRVGYNFIAARGSYWPDVIESLDYMTR